MHSLHIPQALLVVSGEAMATYCRPTTAPPTTFKEITIQAMNEFSADVADFEIEECITVPNFEDFRLLTR